MKDIISVDKIIFVEKSVPNLVNVNNIVKNSIMNIMKYTRVKRNIVLTIVLFAKLTTI